ncbi:hypothetical protein Tco_0575994 [Tanacetum coccineum]
METQKPLLKDEDGEKVDVYMYRSMIGSLMYLTSSRPDIMYLKGQQKLGLWYLKDSPFDLVAYTDSDYAGASLDRKSTIGESDGFEQIVDFFNAIRYALIINPTIYTSCIEQFWSTVKAKTINGEAQLYALIDGKKIIITKSSVRKDLQLEDEEGVDCLPNSTIFEQLTLMGKPKRKDTQVPQPSDPSENVVDEAVHKELGDSLVRAATTASSLEAEQDSGNITKTRSKATPNESSSLGTTSGGGPRCQETMGDTIAQTRFENVSKHSNDSLLTRGNTLRSDEDRLKLNELMELCTNLQNKVLDLEKTKISQQNKIASLKRRVKKLEQKKRSRTHGLKRLRKVGATARVESSGDTAQLDRTYKVIVGKGKHENVVEEVVDGSWLNVCTACNTVTITTTEEITLAQALETLKTSKPKVKGIVFQEPGESTTIKSTPTISSQQSHDKGKGIMIEEPVKPMKKKDLIRLDEEDDIQAKIDVDHQLAKILQAQEQEELFVEENATLFEQLLEKRRKHFAAKRAEAKRNKPPTKAQQRKIMCTYLKSMEGYKLQDLKSKGFDSIQDMFDREFKKVNTFKDFRTELVEGKEKRAGTELA